MVDRSDAAAAAMTFLVADAFPERLAKRLEQLGAGAPFSDEAARAFLHAAWRGENPADLVSGILPNQINEYASLQAAIGRIASNLTDFVAETVLVMIPTGEAPIQLSLADGRIEMSREVLSSPIIGRPITQDLAAFVVMPDLAAFGGPSSRRRQPSGTIDPERKLDRLRGLILVVAAAILVPSAATFAVENAQFRTGLAAASSVLSIGAIAADKFVSRRRRDAGAQRTEGISIKVPRQPWQVKLDTVERFTKGERATRLAAEIGVAPSSVSRWYKLAQKGGRVRLYLKETARIGSSDRYDYFTERRIEAQISAVEHILRYEETLPEVADRLRTSVSNVQLWIDEYRNGSRRELRKLPNIIEDVPLPVSPWEPPESLNERQLRQCLEGHGFLGVKVALIEAESRSCCVLQLDRPSESALAEALNPDWDRDGLPITEAAKQCVGRELTRCHWHVEAMMLPTVTSVSDVARVYIELND